MALQMTFTPYDKNEKPITTYVEPGDSEAMSDYGQQPCCFIAAVCAQNGEEGRVFESEDSSVYEGLDAQHMNSGIVRGKRVQDITREQSYVKENVKIATAKIGQLTVSYLDPQLAEER